MKWSQERDLASAREVQQRFLPPLEQEWRGVHLVAEYRPAHEVGGDFFEVVLREDDRRIITVVGDVAGKGVTAALIMARVSSEMGRLGRSGLGPRRILRATNDWLDRQRLADKFVTAVCVELNLASATWIAASAGHVAPLLRRTDGQSQLLGENGGLPLGLGLGDPWDCEEQVVPARAGDLMVAMTDGLSDVLPTTALVASLETIMAGRGAIPPHRTLGEVRRRLFEQVAHHPGPRDDATLLAMHVYPSTLFPIR